MDGSFINSGLGLYLHYSDQAVFSRESLNHMSELPLTTGLIRINQQHDVTYREILLLSFPLLPWNKRWKIKFCPEVPEELSRTLNISKSLTGQGIGEVPWRQVVSRWAIQKIIWS
jgi:hypothetical protein